MMKLAFALILLATPALAQFNYQAHQSPSVTGHPHYGPRYTYRSGYELPRRTVTTIERDGNRTRIETRRFYRDGGTARMRTSSGRWGR